MTTKEITDQLEGIASVDDFAICSGELTAAWSAAEIGVESVEPILRFMEEHPHLDYGTPGALVHFVEKFHQKGYEERLIECVARKPTTLTVWMLNRVINGSKEPDRKRSLVATMREAACNPNTDNRTLERVNGFLEHLSEC
jgi:hypothetical protein